MVSTKIWVGINVSLGIIAVILLLAFFGLKFPTMGNALYYLDSSQASCLTGYQGKYSLMDTDTCCLELQQQLVKGESVAQTITVNSEPISVTKNYYTSKNTINYLINQKAYRYCKNNGFMVD